MTIGQNDKGLCLRMRLADSTSPQGANVVGKTCLQMRKAVEEGGLGLEVTNCSLCEEAAAAAALAQAASSQSLEVKTVEDNTFDNINIDWLNDFDYTMLDQAPAPAAATEAAADKTQPQPQKQPQKQPQPLCDCVIV